jgi:hypothetical protein
VRVIGVAGPDSPKAMSVIPRSNCRPAGFGQSEQRA